MYTTYNWANLSQKLCPSNASVCMAKGLSAFAIGIAEDDINYTRQAIDAFVTSYNLGLNDEMIVFYLPMSSFYTQDYKIRLRILEEFKGFEDRELKRHPEWLEFLPVMEKLCRYAIDK